MGFWSMILVHNFTCACQDGGSGFLGLGVGRSVQQTVPRVYCSAYMYIYTYRHIYIHRERESERARERERERKRRRGRGERKRQG